MTSYEHAERIGPFRAAMRGLVRRMVVTLTRGPLWQLLGFTNLPGENTSTSDETLTAETFLGIGFYARPASDGKPEAIVVNVGGSNAPAIIAARDEKTRKAIAGAIAAGETMVFNAVAAIHIKADGTVEIRTPGGAAESLATHADLVALAEHVDGLLVGGSGSAASPPGTAPTGTGTQVLKGE